MSRRRFVLLLPLVVTVAATALHAQMWQCLNSGVEVSSFHADSIVAQISDSSSTDHEKTTQTFTRDAGSAPADSIGLIGSDTAYRRSADTSKLMIMSKSPGQAVLRSLACPGWGQLYDESYLKAVVFFGGAVTITGILVWNQSKYANALARYNALDPADPLKDRTYREKEFYRDQRDVTGLWLLGVYALAAVDAYVGAHLYDFDVSDKGVSVLPLSRGADLSLCLRYRF